MAKNVKHDRQGVRTPADIERKYDLGQDFTEVVKIASDAQRAAERAINAAEEAVKTNANFTALGLSVVDGQICVTYESEE